MGEAALSDEGESPGSVAGCAGRPCCRTHRSTVSSRARWKSPSWCSSGGGRRTRALRSTCRWPVSEQLASSLRAPHPAETADVSVCASGSRGSPRSFGAVVEVLRCVGAEPDLGPAIDSRIRQPDRRPRGLGHHRPVRSRPCLDGKHRFRQADDIDVHAVSSRCGHQGRQTGRQELHRLGPLRVGKRNVLARFSTTTSASWPGVRSHQRKAGN